MTYVRSFPPLEAPDARVLVLGSMPGKASLRAREYYAHPQNAFWRMMEALFGVPATLPYAARCRALIEHGVAVWDVLHACTRTSSLDSDIVEASIVPNDLHGFLASHAAVHALFFNGAKAESVYRKHVRPALPEALVDLPALRLPSTSPAHASLNFEAKLEQWRAVLDAVRMPPGAAACRP